MATNYATVEVWVLVDEAGNYVAVDSEDQGALVERYEDQIQPLKDAAGTRTVKLSVKVPLPTVIELEGAVEVEESETALKVA